MAADDSKPSRGLFRSLSKVGESLVTLLHHRAELVTLELQELLKQLMYDFVIICLAIFCFIGSLILATLAAIAYMPEEDRFKWTLIFAVLYAVGALISLVAFRSRIKARGNPFSDSLTELERDREWLKYRK